MNPVVRPRVQAPHGGDVLFLGDALESHWGKAGAVCIVGRTGTGKSTALAWLAPRLPAGNMAVLLDEPTQAQVLDLAATLLVVYTAPAAYRIEHRAVLPLAAWGEDEVLEYVLARAGDRCGSVIARLRATSPDGWPAWPEMWRVCLDEMLADAGLRRPLDGLRRALERVLTADQRRAVGRACLKKEGGALPRYDVGAERLLCYPAARHLVAAEALAAEIEAGTARELLVAGLGAEVVRQAGPILAARPEALLRLKRLAAGGEGTPMAASLLVASGVEWRPSLAPGAFLNDARLEGANWPGVSLRGAYLMRTDLRGAILRGAVLDDARLTYAGLREADLRGALLNRIQAGSSDFACVRADGASGRDVDFSAAGLYGATFDGASLPGALLACARLDGASFRGANLTGAGFLGASVEGADFGGADLSDARLAGVDFRKARLDGATLARANLMEAVLEGVVAHEADFEGAGMQRAAMTGSCLPRACLRGATLGGAQLADVRWERADLRGADLRGCSFHLGSSRSGLVFGEPMQGSRTGFYDDPVRERGWRPADEVRVADLRGVDLRGAALEGTDFYRVDLRGAKLDPMQAEQLRASGAVLED